MDSGVAPEKGGKPEYQDHSTKGVENGQPRAFSVFGRSRAPAVKEQGVGGQRSDWKTGKATPLPALTQEQQQVVESTARRIKVKAFAGAGKSSTLIGFANHRMRGRWLYLAFNRSAKEDAVTRFPSHVKCSTGHGLAFQKFGIPLQEKLRQSINWRGVYEATSIKADSEVGFTYARLLLNTVANFVGSADQGLLAIHLPEKELKLLHSNEKLAKSGKLPDASTMVKDAEKVWQAMIDPCNDKMGVTHDAYLKLMHLSMPTLPYDGILLDESQDSNPAVLSLVQNQPGIQVLVGDPHQSIYAFRKAVDAMTAAQSDQTLELTGSFRYGPEIADFANTILAMKGEVSTIHGLAAHGRVGTSLLHGSAGRTAFISRTNAVMFREAAARAAENRKIYIAGGLESARFDLLKDLYLMYYKKGAPSDALLSQFGSYEEFKAAVQENDEHEWIVRCKIVEEMGQSLPARLASIERNCVNDVRFASQIFSTAHKSKGLEFDHVVLADDFHGASPSKGVGGAMTLTEAEDVEETNILYVAATRARHTLTIPPAAAMFWKKVSPLINPDTRQEERNRLVMGMPGATAAHLERVALYRAFGVNTGKRTNVGGNAWMGCEKDMCDQDPFDPTEKTGSGAAGCGKAPPRRL